MKKILLSAAALTLCVTLVGCGGGKTDPAISNLSNQLDETANSISSIQTISPTEFNLDKTALQSISASSGNIADNMSQMQRALNTDQYYKSEILNKTALLKQNLNTDLKLSKSQISAIKDLTGALNKYTTSVDYSKNEMKSAAKSVSSLKKDTAKNSDKINAKLNRLICNCNARAAYYENILKTLAEIENYVLNEDCNNCDNCNDNYNGNDNWQQPSTKLPEETGISNIDTYQNQNTQNEDETPMVNPLKKPKNIPYNSNEVNRLMFNRGYGMNGYYNGGMNGAMPYGGYPNAYGTYPMTGAYGMNGGYANGINYGVYGNGTNTNGVYGNNMYGNSINGYGGVYGYSNAPYISRFNYSRNTDTYAPMLKNIDTYKINPESQTDTNLQEEVPVATEQKQTEIKQIEKVKTEQPEQQLETNQIETEQKTLNNKTEQQKTEKEEPQQPEQQPVLSVTKLFKHKTSDLDAPTVAHNIHI